MDFSFTYEQKEMRRTVAAFADAEIKPLMELAEETETFPQELFKKLGNLNLLCLAAPADLGGLGAGKLTECLLVEELGRVSSSVAGAVLVHSGVATSAIAEHGAPQLIDRFLKPAIQGDLVAAFGLTEPEAGTDVAGIKLRAVKDGAHYVLDGAKLYITNGTFADFVTTAAVTAPGAPPKRRLSLFVVERGTPGFRVGQKLSKVGNRAAETAELVFEECRVDETCRIGEEGRGLEYIKETLTAGRITHAARSVGVAQAAIDLAAEYAANRKVFGRRVIDFQSVKFGLADMITAVEAARLLTYRAAWMFDNGDECGREASMAKLESSRTAEWVTGAAMHMHGGYGYMAEAPIQRLWRDAKLFPVSEGVNEIQRSIIARNLRPQ